MADAWSTVVEREPEYDDYTRSRVMALLAWEAGRCPKCRSYDSLVPLPKELRHVTWEEHNGRKVEVAQVLCVVCGAADLVQRMWSERHAKDKPIPGQAAPADGRQFVAYPADEEVS